MKTYSDFRQSRRNLLTFVTVSGVTVGLGGLNALLPKSTLEASLPQWQRDTLSVDHGADEALGNYPAYSESIDFGRGHQLEKRPDADFDHQLFG